MSAQLAAVSRDFYQCHSMDDESGGAAGEAASGRSASSGSARALLAARDRKGAASAHLGAGAAHDPLEPQVLAAYDALGADAFYWFSALSRDVPVMLAISLLHRVGDLLELYLKELTEDALRANFVTVYQLLDEIICDAPGIALYGDC